MSKNVKILIIIMLILIIALSSALVYLILNYNDRYSYDKRLVMQTTIKSKSLNETFTENNSIELDDFIVKLSGISFNPGEGEELPENKNLLSITLDFDNKKDTDIYEILYDYIIFDENNNILGMSALFGTIDSDTKRYAAGFVKDKYNTSNSAFEEISNHSILYSFHQENNISEDLSLFSQNLISSLKDEISPKQIHVRIINPRYQLSGEEEKYLANTDLEFILNFE